MRESNWNWNYHNNIIVIKTPTLQQNSILKIFIFLSHEREHVDVVHNVLGTKIGPISISGILPLFMKSCVSLQGELNALWSIKVWAHLVQSELFASFYVSGLYLWIVLKYIKVSQSQADGCGQIPLEPFCFYPLSLMSVITIVLCILLYSDVSWGTCRY